MRIVIFANGFLPNPEAAQALLRDDDYLIAADGGANYLLKMGMMPHLVVGDMDSLGEDAFYELTFANVELDQYPEDKNETDLELALRSAVELRAESILIVGALGGRIDQSLAALSLLLDPILVGIDVRLDDGIEEVFFCRTQVEIQGQKEDIVSLIPWGEVVTSIQTEGLKWALSYENLYPEQTRGISNQMLGEQASVQIAGGLLLIVHRREIS